MIYSEIPKILKSLILIKHIPINSTGKFPAEKIPSENGKANRLIITIKSVTTLPDMVDHKVAANQIKS